MGIKFDLCQILGVSEDADIEAIKAAYRALAKRYHPDVSRDPGTARQFVLIHRAYRILINQDRRSRCDGEHRRRREEPAGVGESPTSRPAGSGPAWTGTRRAAPVRRSSLGLGWGLAIGCVLVFMALPRMVFPSNSQPLAAAGPAIVPSNWEHKERQLPVSHDVPVAAPGGDKELVLDLGNKVMMKLVLIPAGSFTMGSPDSEMHRDAGEGPQREVTISRPFRMGIHDVTQAQYEAVTGRNPSCFRGAANPVENVSWDEAMAFCKQLSARTGLAVTLPTEAQWEYACRAGAATPFCTGQTLSSDQANYDARYTYGPGMQGAYRRKTTPVGSFKPNALGLFDMHGNVWQWCSDWYDVNDYALACATDPAGPPGGHLRVLRGGSWLNSPRDCRCAYRDWCDPTHCNSTIGFRVVAASD